MTKLKKYLQSKNVSDSNITYYLQLLQQFERQFRYNSQMQKNLWESKVIESTDELSKELYELYSNCRKYREELLKIVQSHGRRLYAR